MDKKGNVGGPCPPCGAVVVVTTPCDDPLFPLPPDVSTLYGNYYYSGGGSTGVPFTMTYSPDNYNRLCNPDGINPFGEIHPIPGYWTATCIDLPGVDLIPTLAHNITLLPGSDNTIGFVLVEHHYRFDFSPCEDHVGEPFDHSQDVVSCEISNCETSLCFNGPQSAMSLDFFGVRATDGGLSFRIGTSSAPSTIAASVLVRIHARLPSCPALDPPVVGSPIPDSDVEITLMGGVSSIEATGTTGSDGWFEATLTKAGSYRARVTAPNGCYSETQISINPCHDYDVPIERDVAICCARSCLIVRGLYADGTEPVPISGALITLLGLDQPYGSTGDENGLVCFGLDGLQMESLPLAGTDCSVRRIGIRAWTTSAGWLDSCVDIDIPCGQTQAEAEASPIEVILYGLFDTPVDPDPPEKRFELATALCGPNNCETVGWINRGLAGAKVAVSARFEVIGDDAAYHDILGVVGGGSLIFPVLNSSLAAGVHSGSPWESPPDSAGAPDLEYLLSGYSGHNIDPSLVTLDEPFTSTAVYGNFTAWLRRGLGLWVRFQGGGPSTAIRKTPTDAIDFPDFVGELNVLLRCNVLLCYDELRSIGYDSGWISLTSPSGAGDRDARFRLQVTI